MNLNYSPRFQNETEEMMRVLDATAARNKVNIEKDAIAAHRLLMGLFNHFNEHLFKSCPLPTDNLIITIEQKGEKMLGCFELGHTISVENLEAYMKACRDYGIRKAQHDAKQEAKVEKFGGRKQTFKDEAAYREINNLRVPRIVMNALYNARDLRDLAGTLVHEMVHYWQFKWGARFPKSGGHNAEWADKMVALGLTPVCVDKSAKPGQKTGRNCTHEIVDGGAFDKAFDLLPDELTMPWAAIKMQKGNGKRKCKKKNYRCACGKKFQTTAKVVNIACRDCGEDFIRYLTEAEEEDIDEEEREEVEREQEEARQRRKENYEKSNPANWGSGERNNPDLDDLFGM